MTSAAETSSLSSMSFLQSLSPKFISLEGGEGAGKSTQIKRLQAWLESQGIDVCSTREPGGSESAEQIRELLVTGAGDRWTAMTEALLMAASRAEHVERTIKPALANGKWVLCDRFFDSSIAYQGAARSLGVDKIAALQRIAIGDFAPDITLMLDLPTSIGLSRAKSREGDKAVSEDRFEGLSQKFHETLRQAFLDIAAAEPLRCYVLNADMTPDALQHLLQDTVRQALGVSDG